MMVDRGSFFAYLERSDHGCQAQLNIMNSQFLLLNAKTDAGRMCCQGPRGATIPGIESLVVAASDDFALLQKQVFYCLLYATDSGAEMG